MVILSALLCICQLHTLYWLVNARLGSVISVFVIMKKKKKAFKILFFLFQVINTGISMAPNVSVKIMVPNSFLPQDDKLFNVLDVQVTVCSPCLT